ncbi:hypothetical protein [Breznakiella homolactica]|uniref:Glycosyltransferase family 1 protein n=1 Tax=Breznakiella homolactica TaxID=2798577 RepID=A0A7T8BC39_9SPIR|nr:hypothetical protein [Breznakiella homolactica]QQO09828.1 hypothetical protein JFL75_02650 [Breznakiella homolactica]
MKKVLLKIGSLNIPRNRWLDALAVFDEIYIFSFQEEVELSDPHIHYIKFKNGSYRNRILLRLLNKTKLNMKFDVISSFLIFLLRICNLMQLKRIEKMDVGYIHSSYNDFDDSNLLTLLIKTKKRITRAQKETREYYNYLEMSCLKKSYRIIFNANQNVSFFKKKYKRIFENKEILIGLDEDVRKASIVASVIRLPKLSAKDNLVHAVILAGRVLSDKNEPRSGGRLYYIPLIKEYLDAGMVVHLHTGNIIPINGNNPYCELAQENHNFRIEQKLDFETDYENAYKILSQYDVGILHAFIPDTSVFSFDQINIPHRFYEYQIAGVVPLLKKNTNFVLEDIFLTDKNGLLYEDVNEISFEKIKNKQFTNKTFEEYIKLLYPI